MNNCNYIRPGGARCRAPAISGGKRCCVHRLDGGPRSLNHLKHGARRPSRATNKQETLAEELLVLHRLEKHLDQEKSFANLRYLSAELGRRATKVVELLASEVAEGREPQPLAEAAINNIGTIIKRDHQGQTTRNDTEVRSQRYWAVYGIITRFAKHYHRSPTRQEISRASGIGYTAVYRYIKQLEQDGLVLLKKGRVFLK